MKNYTDEHSPACAHLTVSARKFLPPDACATCRAYQLGLQQWADAHTGQGEPDDDSPRPLDWTGRWCECGDPWPCYDQLRLKAAGYVSE